jgi:hypothetical protein
MNRGAKSVLFRAATAAHRNKKFPTEPKRVARFASHQLIRGLTISLQVSSGKDGETRFSRFCCIIRRIFAGSGFFDSENTAPLPFSSTVHWRANSGALSGVRMRPRTNSGHSLSESRFEAPMSQYARNECLHTAPRRDGRIATALRVSACGQRRRR